MTGKEAFNLIVELKKVFDIVRLVDPVETKVMEVSQDGKLSDSGEVCHNVWGRDQRCANCISAKACGQKMRYEKIEFISDDMYHVTCSPVEIEGKAYSLETVARMHNDALSEAYDDKKFANFMDSLQERLYRDPLTGIMNRRFYEENRDLIQKAQAITIVDVDRFKRINDVFGHVAGDEALKTVVEKIHMYTSQNDTLVRYGGDEIILAFTNITKKDLLNKMESIRNEVAETTIPSSPELKLTISIGCSYAEEGKGASFEEADKQLYVAKLRRNSVAIDNVFYTEKRGKHSLEVFSLTGGKKSQLSLQHFKELDIIKRQNAVIAELSEMIEYACYISQKDKEAICFQLSDKLKEQITDLPEEMPFFEKMMFWAEKAVDPEDLPRFKKATTRERIKAELDADKIYIHDFRASIDGKTQYYRLQFICDKEDPDGFIMGILNVDDKKKEENRRSEEDTLYRMMDLVATLDDRAVAVYVINADTGKYFSRVQNEAFSDDNLLGGEHFGNFYDDCQHVVENMIYAPDRQRMSKLLDLRYIVTQLDIKGTYEVEYRIMQGGTPVRCQLRAIYANEDYKTVLARVRVVDGLKMVKDEGINLDAFMEKYSSIYKVDLDNNLIYPFKLGPRMQNLLTRINPKDIRYKQNAEKFVRHYVVMEDWEKLLKYLHTDKIKEALREKESVSEIVRLISEEGYGYFEVSLSRAGNEDGISECVLGIMDCNDEYVQNMLSSTVMADYYSAYVVNIKTGRYRNIHRKSAYGADWGNVGEYDKVIAAERPFINPQDWHILNSVGTCQKLKQYIIDGNPEEIAYRTTREDYPWEICTVRTMEYFEGEPCRVLVAFKPPQKNRAEELDYQQKHREIDAILRNCIQLINSGTDADTSIKTLLETVSEYYGASRALVNNVNESEKSITPMYQWSREKDEQGNSIPIKGRIEYIYEYIEILKGNGELHTHLGENGEMEVIALPFLNKGKMVGFIEILNPTREIDDLALLRYISAFIQGEQLRKIREAIEEAERSAVITALSDDFDAVSYVPLHENKNEDFVEDHRDLIEWEGIPGLQREKLFGRRLQLIHDNIVHPDDKPQFFAETRRETILEALTLKASYIVNFRGIIDGQERNYQLKFVGDKDASGEYKGFIVGLHNTDVEINQEREMKKALERTVLERTQEIREKNDELNRMNEEIIEMLGEITEARDVESGEHIKRVRGFTSILAKQVMLDMPEYGLTEEKIKLIASASALHDVGKIMIPDAILLKPGKLTSEEFEEMKKHCVKGCEIIEKAPVGWSEEYIKTSIQICRWHHEKYDGRGYPDGLVGDEIPISAQIVSVADCFDALVSKRVYKDSYGCRKAFDMITGGECGSFSPKLIKAFEKCKDEFFALAKSN